MANYLILANDHFLFILIWIWSNYICFFWYYIHIKTQVNRNFSTSTFLFIWYLDEPCDHAVWYYSIPATIKKKTNKQKNTLNNNNSCNNNFKYCFNKLYYDCKHLTVLIIVECRLSLVQSATWVLGSIILLY
jgi:hypothetical protein